MILARRVQACAVKRRTMRSESAMLGKGKAVKCKTRKQECKAVKENITSGQSGDCLYSWGFTYIWVCAQTMVYVPYLLSIT
jgi:hypothetical protein